MATENTPVMTAVDIMQLLPHRFPFLLVDRVDELVKPQPSPKVGWKVKAIKNVTINEPFFPGHFPHRPVMPGVLQIETMAQAAALACVDPTGPKMDVAIVSVDHAKFRRPVVPGDRLEVFSEVIKDRGQMLVVKCEIRVDGQLTAEAELMAKVFPIGTH